MASFENLKEPILEPPSTPRSLLACKKAGVDPKLLIYRTKQQLSDNPKVAEFLFSEVEKDREEMLQDCLKEYNIVCEGITEAEFELMGRPSELQKLVPASSKEVLSDSKRRELIARKQREIEAASERFRRVEEFQDEQQRLRDEENERIDQLLLKKQAEERQRQAQLAREQAERIAKAERDRLQLERQKREQQAELAKQEQEKLDALEKRLESFRGDVRERNALKAEIRAEKMQKSEAYYAELERQKNDVAEARKRLEEDAERERLKRIQLEQQRVKDRIREREKRIQLNVQQRMALEERQRREFEQELAERCKEHEGNRQRRVGEIQAHFGDKNSKQDEKTQQLMEQFSQDKYSGLEDLQTRDLREQQKYDDYKDNVLIKDRLKHEKYKLEEERGRIRAMRLQQKQEYERKFLDAQLKLRFEKLEEELQAKETERLYVVHENSKFEAEKEKMEYEKYFGKNGVKISRSPSPASKTSSQKLREATEYRKKIASPPPRNMAHSGASSKSDVKSLVEQELSREKERKQALQEVKTDEEKLALQKQFVKEREASAEKLKAANIREKNAIK